MANEHQSQLDMLSLATEVVTGVNGLVAQSIGRVKAKMVEDGQSLDDQQLVGYELAYNKAEATACQVAIDYSKALTEKYSDYRVELDLALVFIAEAVTNIKSRYIKLGNLLGNVSEAMPILESESVETIMAAVYRSPLVTRVAEQLEKHGSDFEDTLLAEEYALAKESFSRFAADVIEPRAEEIHRQDLMIPEDILQPLRDMGCFALCVPEKFGGIRPDDDENTLGIIVVTEALAGASLCAGGGIITRPEIFSRALIKGGTEQQKEHWLPKIAAGDPLGAVAVTEADYGSDVASLRLRAEKTEGGWILNGNKAWSTFAGKAGLLLVVARTNPDLSLGHKGLSMFFVEKPSFDGHDFSFENPEGGKLSAKATPTLGYRGMHSFDLFFEDYFVPDSHLIGGESGVGKGFYYIMAGFEGGRIQTAARASGIMQAALSKALTYTQDRKVFGKSVFDYQLSKFKLAKIAAILMVCKQFSYSVARLMDENKGQMEASLVKLFACKNSEWVTREAMQLHGGMGYAEESAVSRYFVDARVLSIFEGAEETLALKVIFKALMA